MHALTHFLYYHNKKIMNTIFIDKIFKPLIIISRISLTKRYVFEIPLL